MHVLGVNGKMKSALGLMSGTSMDGIDVALIRTDGDMQVERGPAMSFPYTDTHRNMIREAIADARLCQRAHDRPGRLAEVETELTELSGAAVSAFLRKQGIERETIDVIGFHGQTVVHRPADKMTVQLGDPTLFANLVRRPVVCDLRQNDVQHDGQGAPLVPVYHQALASEIQNKPVVVLNIGGVANVTWIGRDKALLAFDTGPGNALLDDWVSSTTGTPFDAGGRLAASGRVDQTSLASLLTDPFFDLAPPKSLDRNHFKLDAVALLNAADGAATLTAFTVQSIITAQKYFPEAAQTWIVTGGGRKNDHIVAELREHVSAKVDLAEDVGFDGDSMEAEAWAYLAVRSTLGLPITFPGTTGVPQPLTGGRLISWPV